MKNVNYFSKKRILIIDDNSKIHLDFKKILLVSKEKESDLDKLEETLLGKTPDLQDETYSIDYASQGEEGFGMVEASIKDKEPYAVAFIDIRMPPGWDGIETISKIWEICPDLQIVICTAYSDYSWDDLFKKFGHTDKLLILKKPFDNIEVRQLTYTLSKKWELNRIANLKLDELERNVIERTKEFQQSEEKYRTMIENSNDMIWTLDTEGNFVYFNKKSQEITDYDIKEGAGKSFGPIILKEDLEMVQNVFLDTLAGNSNHYEVRIHDNTRTKIITLSVNTTPIIKEGIVVGTVIFGRNITKHKQIEQSIKENEEKLRNFVENTTLGIWCFQLKKPTEINISEDQMIDKFFESTCVECNETYASMMDSSQEEILGLKLSDAMPAKDENKEYLRTFIKNGFKISGSISRELTKDGKEKYFSNSMVGVIKNGKLINAWGTQSDITKRVRAEEEVRKSEEKLRLMIDNSPNGFCATDLRGNYVDMNLAFCNIMGYSKKEMMYKHFNQFSHPDDRVKNKELYEKLVKGKISYFDLEKRYIHKNGDIIYALIRAQLVRNNKGKALFEIAVIENITERKKAERKNTLLSNIVKQTTEGIALADLNNNLIFINDAWCDMHGYKSYKELLGKNLSIFHNKEQLKNDVIPFNKKVMKHDTYSGEVGHIMKDGISFPTLMTTTVLKDDKGNPYGIAGIAKDITERKQAEETLKQSEESYRDLFNNATDAIYIQDTEGRFIDVNQGVMDMYGYPKKFFIGKTPEFLSAPGKNDMNKIIGYIQDALNGKPQQYDFWGIRKNGEIFPKIVRSKRISYLGQDAIITFALDITERKKAEEKEKNHHRKIEILSETAMQFVDLSAEENIYEYIALKIKDHVGENAYVMVNSIIDDKILITRAITGIEKHSEQLMNIIGKNPLGNILNIEGHELDYLRDGKIHCNAKDLYGLCLGTIPKQICKSIEKITNMGDVYTAGIIKGKNLLGTIIILMKKNCPKLTDINFMETFIKQAAIAVQKRQAEKDLIESEQLSSAVIKDSPLGISVRDQYGTLILYNEAWNNIWGFTNEQIESYKIKRTKLKIDGKDSYLGKHQQQIKEIYENGGSYFVPEMKLKPGNNKAEWIMQRFYAIMDGNDKVEKVVILTTDISERKKVEKIQKILYNIASVVNTTKDIHELFIAIRDYLSEIVNTDNFYIALYDEDKDTFSLPYHKDEKDDFESFSAGKTLTAYVVRTGKPLFGTEEKREELIQTGEVIRGEIGAHAKIWVGVPLKLGKVILGVIAVQSYTNAFLFAEKDLEILEFVSGEIALAIAHKQAEENLKNKNKELIAFNKIAVGREVRMIDLKKETNALLKSLGKEPKYKIAE